jgi:hypothetical protein
MPDSSATLGEMIDDAIQTLAGYTAQQEQATHLTSSIDAVTLAFTVADGSVIRKGQVEIGGELLWVESVSGGTVTIAPYGRGYRSTTAAAHSAGSRVVVQPMFPRSSVHREINNTIAAISDDVYGIAAANITYDGPTIAHELPAADFPGVDAVLDVTWQTESVTDVWLPVRRFRFRQFAASDAFPSGNVLELMDPIMPGAEVRVVFKQAAQMFPDYRTAALAFLRENYPEYANSPDDVVLGLLASLVPPDVAESQRLTTATYLPSSCRDLVVLGAVSALAWGVDLSKASQVGPSPDQIDESRGGGQSAALARQLFQRFQLRLEAERNKLLSAVPAAVRYER